MKLTLAFTAGACLLADTALSLHLPAFFEPRQQQSPPSKCSLYSGFKDSSSFTSFCKQLPRATKAATSIAINVATSTPKKIPSISTQKPKFTFDGGRTSTLSPINPVISSAAAGNTYEMQNYTVTTSPIPSKANATATTTSKLLPSDVEVNCYINGSKIPCTRTAGLTRTHGYTYEVKTTSGAKGGSSQPAATSSKVASTSSAKPTSSSKAAYPSRPATSSKKSSSSAVGLGASNSTTSAPVSGASNEASGKLTSTNCTNTQNLTRHHGYTYSQGTAPAASTAKLTAKLTSSVLSSSSAKSMPSAVVTVSANSSFKAIGTGTTLSTSFVGSYDCNNITAVEPHRPDMPTVVSVASSAPGSSSAALTTSSAGVIASSTLVSSSVAQSTSSSSSSSVQAQTASSTLPTSSSASSVAKAQTTSSTHSASSSASSPTEAQTTNSAKPTFKPVGHAEKFQQTSTTTVVDATVTTIVPCATDVGSADKPADQKRDMSFMPHTAAGGLCDAGVYCVNSTYISDAPPSWDWDAVPLKQGQLCLEDNVFNTEWVEQQCACAGL